MLKAVTAATHKLARLICAMLTKDEEYSDRGQACYEERYRQRMVAKLNWRAQQVGQQLGQQLGQQVVAVVAH